jgi:hypothetical protein
MALPPDLRYLDPLLDVLVDEYLRRLNEQKAEWQTEGDNSLIVEETL